VVVEHEDGRSLSRNTAVKLLIEEDADSESKEATESLDISSSSESSGAKESKKFTK
jgi:hypothetical protein